jgi:hypothetical protein
MMMTVMMLMMTMILMILMMMLLMLTMMKLMMTSWKADSSRLLRFFFYNKHDRLPAH